MVFIQPVCGCSLISEQLQLLQGVNILSYNNHGSEAGYSVVDAQSYKRKSLDTSFLKEHFWKGDVTVCGCYISIKLS